MSLICASCSQKQDLLNKYLKLIKLLKAKCEKTEKSLLKNLTSASETLHQTLQQSPRSSQPNMKVIHLKPRANQDERGNKMIKTDEKYLGIVVVSNKIKKALLKHSFDKLEAAVKTCKPQNTRSGEIDYKSLISQTNLSSIVQQALSYGKELQSRKQIDAITLKQLYIQMFDLQSKNSHYQNKINRLQKQVQQAQKRLLKQNQKKRQSLQTVGQEMREKNQHVVQLLHTIKRYQKILGKSLERFDIQNVLIQDEQDLKKTCLRLQNINEKLNCDIRNAQSNIQKLNDQLVLLSTQNQNLKTSNKTLKQRNFDLSQQGTKYGQLGQTYKNLCSKFNKKIQKIKLKEKQLSQNLKSELTCKNRSLYCSGDIKSFKKTEASQQLPLSTRTSIKQLDIGIKIEQIFSFLFNIQVQDYKILNQQYFDQDQLELLKSHKNSYLNCLTNQNHKTKIKTQKLLKNNDLDQTDEICYLRSPQKNPQNSFFNALQSMVINNVPQKLPNKQTGNLKIIDLQIQKSELIQKISQLKDHHMHIRNVFLNFLKTLDLSYSKSSQSQSILQVIFQFFEYSQDQKLSIFKEKKKKFWGIY